MTLFPFREALSPAWTFGDPVPRPVRGARIKDSGCKSLIREERENDVFPFPWSKKSRIGLFATLSMLMGVKTRHPHESP